MRTHHSQQGFAMMEVLVTAVIIAIGVSGMGVLLMRAIQGTQDSSMQSQAMWMVQDYVGRIRANTVGARAGHYVLNGAQDCTNPPAMICAEIFQNGAEVAADTCDNDPTNNTGLEMATFDNWITVCGMDSNVFDSAADFILNPVLTSTCSQTSARVSTATGLPDCVQYNVELQWDTRITKGSADAAERINQNTYSMIVELN